MQGFDVAGTTAYIGNVTDKGEDTSTGVGVKLGWTGQLSQNVALGVTAQPQISMSKFSKYKGLFAEQGKFDIPAVYGVGLTFKASPATTLAFDVSQIKYGSVKSIANKGEQLPSVTGALLGNNDGAGFGWKDQTVYKIGVIHQYSSNLALRAGFNYAKMPIDRQEHLLQHSGPGHGRAASDLGRHLDAGEQVRADGRLHACLQQGTEGYFRW